ncbi:MULTISPECIES: LysR family transcriptional regulator [Bacillus cereus group]|uniref:LysR family transcriptional regulator n=1 Tax=Bacillus cereus group TaxID=86661 RepID=UPI000863EAC5|nr:LysR family transcriptional regulator [Bacillus mycoides]MBJ8073477.1 LysR family transcriptional regulator [Bacillus cereus]MBJ8190734.1 LysR family transcriptional regulator [Bacillus cereus]OHX30681.1 transcriptional regulator, LysR family [Bacillus mycoides]SCM87471.1 Transcriptional regulator, LysR family [Bacillus mycoides]
MNIEQLKLIVTLSEERQLSRVAKKLNLTPSAVSQAIKNLEKELNTTLFNRSKSGTYPTTEGLYVIKSAYEILEKIDGILDYTTEKNERPKLKLKFAVIPGIIPPLIESIKKLKNEFPFIEMEIIEVKTQQVLTYLKMEQVDFALITHPDTMRSKNITYNVKKICNGEFNIAMNRNSKLALYDHIDFKAIVKEPLVLFQDEHILNYVRQMEKKNGEQVNILFLTNNSNSIIYAVKNNFAITVSPHFAFNNDFNNFFDDIKRVPITTDVSWPPFSLWFVYSKNSSLNEIADTLFKLIHHHVNSS